jgi:hypothetical protein
MNYNHMSRRGGVLIIRLPLWCDHPNIGRTACYSNRRRVLYKVVLYAGQQPFQLGDQRLNRGSIRLGRPLASPISFHVLWILLRPRLLAVSTQRAVERIFLQLFAVVIGAAATLAVTGAADHLVRMAARRLKLLAAVWACLICGISWAHDCITSGVMTVQPGQQIRKSSNSRGY